MLNPQSVPPVPEMTARVARTALPYGNRYLTLRNKLGTIFNDAMFAHLFSTRGRPAEALWRLAVVTVVQFAEKLSDRKAAEAVRTRSESIFSNEPYGTQHCTVSSKLSGPQ